MVNSPRSMAKGRRFVVSVLSLVVSFVFLATPALAEFVEPDGTGVKFDLPAGYRLLQSRTGGST